MLLVFVLAFWWDFERREADRVMSESLNRPVFAACVIPECPHCKGIGDRLKEFAANRSELGREVVFTQINCRESDVCRRAKVTKVPTMILIRGKSAKYWRQTQGKTPAEWNRFLENSLGPRLYDRQRDGDAEETAFHLEIRAGEDDVLQEWERVAQAYEAYRCRFTHKFGAVTLITANLSKTCSVQRQIAKSEIEEFVNKYKFGDAHHYDWSEFRQQRQVFPVALSMVRDTIRDSQRAALATFSGKYCGKMRFGWASAQLDPKLWAIANMTAEDAPLLFAASTPKTPCSVVSRRKTGDRVHMKMLEHVVSGTKCTNDTVALTEDDDESPAMLPYFVVYYVASMVASASALLSTFCIDPGDRYTRYSHADFPDPSAL